MSDSRTTQSGDSLVEPGPGAVSASPAARLSLLGLAWPIVYAKPFLALMGGTLFVESMNVSIAATLRAHAHTRDAMLVALGQNVLNVIGNCLLLFGLFGFPKLGVVGVAISSVFSRVVSCVVLWIILARRTHLKLRWRDFFSIQGEKVRRILHIGLPAAGENISYWIAFMVITTFIAHMGATPLATQTYTMNINRWVILLNVSIGLGLVGIWISMICDEWTRGMIMYHRWRKRKWLPAAERSRAVARDNALADAQSAAPQEG